MNKEFPKNINEIMNILFSLMECSRKNCLEKKKKLLADSELVIKYKQAELIKDREQKIKVLTELGKNNLLYEYDKCVIKNCKKILIDIINIFKKNMKYIPNNNSNFNKLIKDNELILKKKELTKKDQIIFYANMTELMRIAR